MSSIAYLTPEELRLLIAFRRLSKEVQFVVVSNMENTRQHKFRDAEGNNAA